MSVVNRVTMVTPLLGIARVSQVGSVIIQMNAIEQYFHVVLFIMLFKVDVIYHQTRETVFHRDIQTPRKELKIRLAEYF